MFYKIFISQIYLNLVFIFAGMSCLRAMEERYKSHPVTTEIISGFSKTISIATDAKPADFYTKENLELIELVFLKAMDMMAVLNIEQSPTKVVDFGKVSEAQEVLAGIKPFFGPDAGLSTISIKDFFIRIAQNSIIPPACYVVALIYIDRLINDIRATLLLNQAFSRKKFIWNSAEIFNEISFYRIFLLAIMLASKTFMDVSYKNESFAMLGRIEPQEIATLEKLFLYGIKFNLSVSEGEFNHFVFAPIHEKASFSLVELGKKCRSDENFKQALLAKGSLY